MERNKTLADGPGGDVIFSPRVDPDEAPARAAIVVTGEMWARLGKPNTVTVTVEPGDQLNK